MRWKVGLLAASDHGSQSERVETSAQVIRELVEEELGGDIVDYRIVPEEIDEMMAALIEMAEYYKPDLILTTGGIGMGPRDVTPEATLKVVDRLAPGFAEAMRAALMRRSGAGMMTRGVAGIRGRTFIVNLPGAPEGVHDSLTAILDRLPDAMRAIHGLGGDEAV